MTSGRQVNLEVVGSKHVCYTLQGIQNSDHALTSGVKFMSGELCHIML